MSFSKRLASCFQIVMLTREIMIRKLLFSFFFFVVVDVVSPPLLIGSHLSRASNSGRINFILVQILFTELIVYTPLTSYDTSSRSTRTR